MNTSPTLYAGIDGGGTKCSAILFNHNGQILGQGRAGAANAARDLPTSIDSMISSVEQALQSANLSIDLLAQVKVSAGLAGACVPQVKTQLENWQHPFAEFQVTSDLVAACYGAHAGNDGALMIMGTGSAAARFQLGQLTQFGGHGFLLGDKGSGAWFGRSAVSQTLEAFDGIIDSTELHRQIQESLDVKNANQLVQRMIHASASEFAELAPLVLELAKYKEPSSLALVKQGVTYLESLSQQALHNTRLSIVLMGGLASPLKPWFSQRTLDRVVDAKGCPEWGAVRLLKADFPLVN